ncbi:MAG: type II toxin-antitoxin system RelE/ParE family toxin [Deltaproteobacteria bacterium]|nr:type II toxin-antitoxin system RelE/ParE family toxin [Deltaproteobacteria bacterium]
MRKLEWTVPALQDLVAAGEYIAQENPNAAQRMAARVKEAAEHLRDHPNLGRPGRLSDTKELAISGTPFIVDGVAKSRQLLRCCKLSRHCGVPKYASFLEICAPRI